MTHGRDTRAPSRARHSRTGFAPDDPRHEVVRDTLHRLGREDRWPVPSAPSPMDPDVRAYRVGALARGWRMEED